MSGLKDKVYEFLTSSTTRHLSSKRAVMVVSAFALILGFLALTFSGSWWTLKKGDIGMGAVTAILGVGTIVAGLAGLAYRKPELPLPPPLPDPTEKKEGE